MIGLRTDLVATPEGASHTKIPTRFERSVDCRPAALDQQYDIQKTLKLELFSLLPKKASEKFL